MKKIRFFWAIRLILISLISASLGMVFNYTAFSQLSPKPIFSNLNDSHDLGVNVPCQSALKSKKNRHQTNQTYSKFLFIGDSIMEYLGYAIQSTLQDSYNIKDTKLDYKISSGLNRIDFYDWYERTPKLISCYQSEVVVIMFGGNDDQNIKDDQGNEMSVLTPEWKQVYRHRVERYAQLLSSSSVKKIYWVGQPISSNPHYNQYFSIFNQIYEDVSHNYPKIKFINTWNIFAINGKFTQMVVDRFGNTGNVRAKDGVHITKHGSRILADLVIDKMRQDRIITVKSDRN